VTAQLNQLRSDLEMAKATNPAEQSEIRAIADHMDELLYREEMMWLQRSRISSLREGDHNTRFFHMKAKWRAKKNNVRKLKQSDDTWCNAPNEMKSMVMDFFVDLCKPD
jgi:hypothetical protein